MNFRLWAHLTSSDGEGATDQVAEPPTVRPPILRVGWPTPTAVWTPEGPVQILAGC